MLTLTAKTLSLLRLLLEKRKDVLAFNSDIQFTLQEARDINAGNEEEIRKILSAMTTDKVQTEEEGTQKVISSFEMEPNGDVIVHDSSTAKLKAYTKIVGRSAARSRLLLDGSVVNFHGRKMPLSDSGRRLVFCLLHSNFNRKVTYAELYAELIDNDFLPEKHCDDNDMKRKYVLNMLYGLECRMVKKLGVDIKQTIKRTKSGDLNHGGATLIL